MDASIRPLSSADHQHPVISVVADWDILSVRSLGRFVYLLRICHRSDCEERQPVDGAVFLAIAVLAGRYFGIVAKDEEDPAFRRKYCEGWIGLVENNNPTPKKGEEHEKKLTAVYLLAWSPTWPLLPGASCDQFKFGFLATLRVLHRNG
jgi:hypothetical protein